MTIPGDETQRLTTAPTHARHHVLGLLCVMSFILYLDRMYLISASCHAVEQFAE
jgi:hypothetical protein